jgi:hypothetical protein
MNVGVRFPAGAPVLVDLRVAPFTDVVFWSAPWTTPPSPRCLRCSTCCADRSAFDTLVARTPPADIAEALRGLPAEDATAVMCALPFDVAVKILDEPGARHLGKSDPRRVTNPVRQVKLLEEKNAGSAISPM